MRKTECKQSRQDAQTSDGRAIGGGSTRGSKVETQANLGTVESGNVISKHRTDENAVLKQ